MLKRLACIAIFLAASVAPISIRAQAQTQAQTTLAPQMQTPGDRSTPPATFRVTGRVVNSLTEAPVAGAYVTISAASASNSTLNVTLRAGADGGFAFTEVPAGHYSLRARRKGYDEQMYLQHEQFSTAIIVGPNLDSENLVFPLPPEGVISGEVMDEAGEPVPQAQMLLFREDTENGKHGKHLVSRQATEDDGRYRFAHLKAGNYFLAVSAQPWYAKYAQEGGGAVFYNDKPPAKEPELANPGFDVVFPISYYPNSTEASGAATISVQAGGSVRADMRLAPIPALHMTVEMGETDPHSFTQIQAKQEILGVYEDSSPEMNYQFGPEGDSDVAENIRDGHKSGSRFLQIGGLRPGPTVVEVTTYGAGGPGKSGTSKSVAVDPTDGQTIDMRSVPSGAAITGTVKLAGGASVPPGVRVMMGDVASRNSFRADTGTDGTFKFTGESFKPGAYRLFAVAPGGLELRSITAIGANVTGHKIEIADGSDVQLTLTLARGVTGRVKGIVERAGKPAPGLMVVLVPQNLEDSVEYRRDQSDSDGSFSLNLVSPGKYTVVAVGDWQLEWANPEVIRRYLAGGESVEVTGGEERSVKVAAK